MKNHHHYFYLCFVLLFCNSLSYATQLVTTVINNTDNSFEAQIKEEIKSSLIPIPVDHLKKTKIVVPLKREPSLFLSDSLLDKAEIYINASSGNKLKIEFSRLLIGTSLITTVVLYLIDETGVEKLSEEKYNNGHFNKDAEEDLYSLVLIINEDQYNQLKNSTIYLGTVITTKKH